MSRKRQSVMEHEEKLARIARNGEIISRLIGILEIPFTIIAIGFVFIVGIKILVGYPVEKVTAIIGAFANLAGIIFENINANNRTSYFIILFLLCVLWFYKRRNKWLTKEKGRLTKLIEQNDLYRSSSCLDAYGENKSKRRQ